MSSQQSGPPQNDGDIHPAGQTIEDFGDLYPRRTGFANYSVLSLSDGEPTAYRVDLIDLECSCPDTEYNNSGDEVCKHLATALFDADNHWSVESQALNDVSEEIREARQAAETCRQHATALSADRAVDTRPSKNGHTTQSEPSEDTSAETVEETEDTDDDHESYGVDDPEAVVRAWLDENVLKPDAIDTAERTHDNRVGIGLLPDTDALNSNQNDQFKDAVKSLDDSECHAGFDDDGCYTCGVADGEYFWFIPGGEIERLAEGGHA